MYLRLAPKGAVTVNFPFPNPPLQSTNTTGASGLLTSINLVLTQPVAVFVKVSVTVPAERPVTNPALVTVAMALLLVAQVPPEAGVTLVVPPKHTVPGPPNTGSALMVNDTVLLQPVAVLVKVSVTVPAETPVTTPAFVTVAMPVLLLDQVPPVPGVTLAVVPMQVAVAPPKVGSELTVNALVLLHPVAVFVNVSVTAPAETPVTTPAFVTVALPVLLLLQVPPVEGVTLAVAPTHTAVAPPKVGKALTVTVFEQEDVQPFAPVTTTVTV